MHPVYTFRDNSTQKSFLKVVFKLYVPWFRCGVYVNDFIVIHVALWVCSFKDGVSVSAVHLVAADRSFVDWDDGDGSVWQSLQPVLFNLERRRRSHKFYKTSESTLIPILHMY